MTLLDKEISKVVPSSNAISATKKKNMISGSQIDEVELKSQDKLTSNQSSPERMKSLKAGGIANDDIDFDSMLVHLR